ncbi:MAG: peptidoglycan-binding domain-containing protein [Bryobacteraceae bacterium]
MRTLAALIGVLCLAFPGFSEAPRTARRSTSHAASKRSVAVAKRSPRGRTGKSARSRKKRQSWRTGQVTPTPQRYKEIQQALIDRGYLQGPARGVWGPDCSQALKKFQQDQNLEPSGKLDSLSLIALGLGPKREPLGSTAVVHNPPPGSGARQ